MEIWTSFEASFLPFPKDNAMAENPEAFMDAMSEALYDEENWEWPCLISTSNGFKTLDFTFDGDVNPKEVIPALAQVIADHGGQGEITTEYVTNIMEMPDLCGDHDE